MLFSPAVFRLGAALTCYPKQEALWFSSTTDEIKNLHGIPRGLGSCSTVRAGKPRFSLLQNTELITGQARQEWGACCAAAPQRDQQGSPGRSWGHLGSVPLGQAQGHRCGQSPCGTGLLQGWGELSVACATAALKEEQRGMVLAPPDSQPLSF